MGRKLSDIKTSTIILYKDFIDLLSRKYGLKLNKKSNTNKYSGNGKYIDAVRDVRNQNIPSMFIGYVSYFQDVLENNYPEQLLSNYYRNIASVNVYGVIFQLGDLIKLGKFSGKYDVNRNDIVIDLREESDINAIYHELFHLASARRNSDGTYQVGLTIFKKNGYVMGSRLNEGYTDLLTSRYFGNEGYKSVYNLEFLFANLLEQIVGREKMEAFYLTADLKGLANELSNYDSIDEIAFFIKELDMIHDDSPSYQKQVRLENILFYLVKSYFNKQVMEKGNANNIMVINAMTNFIRQIPSTIMIDDEKHIIDIEKLYNEVMGSFGQPNVQPKVGVQN